MTFILFCFSYFTSLYFLIVLYKIWTSKWNILFSKCYIIKSMRRLLAFAQLIISFILFLMDIIIQTTRVGETWIPDSIGNIFDNWFSTTVASLRFAVIGIAIAQIFFGVLRRAKGKRAWGSISIGILTLLISGSSFMLIDWMKPILEYLPYASTITIVGNALIFFKILK